MSEQSHKDEMRAALRGDFERLRARAEHGAARESVLIPSAPAPDAPPVTVVPVAKGDSTPRSWLERLLDRRSLDVR